MCKGMHILGMHYLVASFTEMTPQLLGLPGVTCFFSEKVCQDPVESFFGTWGGRSDNPTVKQFCDNTVTLRVQGSAALEPVCGNRERKRDLSTITDIAVPLPKRTRYSKEDTNYVHINNVSSLCCYVLFNSFLSSFQFFAESFL